MTRCLSRAIGGPGVFFARHPALYALSIAGAALGAAAFARRAATAPSGVKRALWAAAFVSEVGQILGMWQARRAGQRVVESRRS